VVAGWRHFRVEDVFVSRPLVEAFLSSSFFFFFSNTAMRLLSEFFPMPEVVPVRFVFI